MRDERLRDRRSDDPIWADLEAMCRAQPATRVDPFMEGRVLARLTTPRERAWRLRPAYVVGALLLLAGTASAVWRPLARWLTPAPSAPSAITAQSSAAAPSRPTQPTQPTQFDPPPATGFPGGTPTIAAPGVLAAVETPRKSHPALPSAHPTKHVTAGQLEPATINVPTPPSTAPLAVEHEVARPLPAPAARRPFDPEGSLIVQSALRALRVEHRIGRARSLLADYLRRFPDGPLVEDAVALQIEAAMADGNQHTARELATRYLRDYPAGRFREAAHQALTTETRERSKDDPSPHP
jgi:hypothetical protein